MKIAEVPQPQTEVGVTDLTEAEMAQVAGGIVVTPPPHPKITVSPPPPPHA